MLQFGYVAQALLPLRDTGVHHLQADGPGGGWLLLALLLQLCGGGDGSLRR